MDFSIEPMKYYSDSSDNDAISNPIFNEFKAGLDAIYVNDPLYIVKPNVALDPEYTGLNGDKHTRTMSM